MKNPITTKDLGALHELMVYEQWASTKFKMLEELTDDPAIKTMFKNICLKHGTRFDSLYNYLTTNSGLGGAKLWN